MDVKRLDFIWRLVAMSVTSFSSWFHGCVNCFLAWGLYLAPLLNQTLIRIVRHFMPILKAFIPEMSVEGLRTFCINQYHRFQALRSLWWTVYQTMIFGHSKFAKSTPTKIAVMTTWALLKVTMIAQMKLLKLSVNIAWHIAVKNLSYPESTKKWNPRWRNFWVLMN